MNQNAGQNLINRRWVLASYPEGMPTHDNWRLESVPVPELQPGQILVKLRYLSVDPYMRGRIHPGKNYAEGVSPGELMTGGGVGEVIASGHPDWKVGDVAESMFMGWQEYAVVQPGGSGPRAVNKVDPSIAPIEASLSWLGMPGMTAYFGLFDLGKPRPGDVVVVSAASGAVGQIVGQLAKLAGCRVIAIASSEEKLNWCREIGFDEGINYRTESDLVGAVARACPNGVDIFFDNTAGPIHDAVVQNLALHARVIMCGRVSLADRFGQPDIGPRFMGQLIVNRASMHGLLVFDYWHRRNEALKRLAQLGKEGKIRFREDVARGIEAMPDAFLRLLRSENFGKQLVALD